MTNIYKIFRLILVVALMVPSTINVNAANGVDMAVQIGKPGPKDEYGVPSQGSEIYGKGEVVNPGDEIQVDVLFNNTESTQAASLEYTLVFDNELVEVSGDEYGEYHHPYEVLDSLFTAKTQEGRPPNIVWKALHQFGGSFNESSIVFTMNGVSGPAKLETPSDTRIKSYFFKVKEDIEPGTPIDFYLNDKDPVGMPSPAVGDINQKNVLVTLLNGGRSTVFVSGGEEPPVEEANVTGITVNGEVSGVTYDYFENMFIEGEIDYRDEMMVVPNAVGSLTFDFEVENAEDLSITTYKANDKGERFGSDLSLHVGDNYFKSVIKDGTDIVGEYEFKVKRLSNNTDFNISASANGDVLTDDNKEFRFKSNVDTINIETSVKEEVYSYQGKEYKYSSEAVIDAINILDVSNKSKDEFEYIVKVSPEDTLDKYKNVKGNVPSTNAEASYTFKRMSGDASISNVKLSTLEGTSLGEPSVNGNNYTFNVSNDVSNAKLEFDTNDKNTVVTNPSNIENIVLDKVATEVTITVTAEDGNQEVYKVFINKEARNTNDLEKLNVIIKDDNVVKVDKTYDNDLSINIELDDLEYSENYSISLEPTLKNDGSKVVSNPIKDVKLSVGLNTFEVIVQAEDGTPKTYTVKVEVLKNSNSNIDDGDIDISIDDEDLVDPENPIIKDNEDIENKTFTYNINVKYSKKTFGKNDLQLKLPSGASAKYPSDINLSVGHNEYTVVVTSEDGKSVSTYIFNVNRAENDSIDLKFEVITTPPAEVTGSDLNYNVKVDTSVELYELKVNASEGTIIESGGSGTYPLVKSDHVHKIVAKSQDGSKTETYELQFERIKNTDARLKNLFVTHESMDKADVLSQFNNGTLSLTVDASWIQFDPIASHISSKVTINNEDVNPEKKFNLDFDKANNFTIKVTSETGDTANYTVRVNRKASSIASLQDLEYYDLSDSKLGVPGFGLNTDLNYEIMDEYGEDVNIFKIVPTKTDEKSEVLIKNNGENISTIKPNVKSAEVAVPLKNGKNSIELVVTAHDKKTTETYTVVVNKALSSNTDIGDEGIIPDGDNDHQFSPTEDPYVYNVYVPYGTKTYSKDDFIVDLSDGQVLEVEQDSIELDLNPEVNKPNGVFKFKVIAQDGIAESTYEIHVFILAGEYPLLDTVEINGIAIENFDAEDFIQTFNLDDYMKDDNRFFVFKAIGDTNKSDIQPEMAVIDTLGKTTTTHVVNLKGKNGYDSKYTFTLTKTLSGNNDLSNIEITEPEGIDIDFDKDKIDYEIDVGDADKIIIDSDANDKTSNIKGNGEHELIPGDNEIHIKVEAEDGSEKDYVIKVSKDITLDSLTLGDRDLLDDKVANFTKTSSTLIYDVIDNYGADEVLVDLIAKAHESVSISSPANNTVTLETEGSFSFELTPVKGEPVTVVINYKRDNSSNPTLASLKLDGEEIELIEGQYSYEVEVRSSLKNITFDDFEAIPTHIKSVVTGSGAMNIEDNKNNLYIITVKAEDGSTQEYEIKITRGAYKYLENLAIEAGQGYLYDPFDKARPNYDALVFSNVSNFRFVWELEEGIKVINESELKDIPVSDLPKTFEIKVQDGENPDIGVYSVKVDKGLSNRLRSLESSEGVINFKPENTYYDVFVSANSDKVSLLNIVAEDSNAVLSIGGETIVDSYEVEILYETTKVEVLLNNGGAANIYTVNFIKTEEQTGVDKITANDGKNVWEGSQNEDGSFEITVDHGVDIKDLDINVILDVPGGIVDIVDNGDGNYKVTVTDPNGISKDYDLTIKNDLSDNNYLKSIHVNGNLVAGFNRYATEYTYHISYDEFFEVTAVAEDSSAVVTIDDFTNVKDGEVINISVTSQKGNVRTYKVTVSKELENIAVLDSLGLKETSISPKYSKTNQNYYATVPYELDTVTVEYDFSHAGSVQINETENATVNLAEGDNTISVKVIAEDSSEFTYFIHVNRNTEAQNYLDTLEVTSNGDNFPLNPSFEKNTLAYTVKVPMTQEEVEVTGTFAAGLNVFGLVKVQLVESTTIHQVRVIENGVVRVYTLTIVKEASNIAYLENLETDSGVALVPEFDPDQIVYELSVGHEVDSIVVTGTPNEKSSVVGDGEVSLVPGKNNVTITVTAEDGVTQRSYTIVVNRDLELLSLNIGDKDYTATRTETVDGTYKYILDDKIDSNTTQSMITPKFNHGSISYEGLANAKTIEESGIITFTMTARDEETSYDVEVSYERELSSDATVESINIAGQEIKITLGVYEYSIEVPYNFETLHKNNVIVKTRHANASFDAPESMDIEFSKDNIYSITVTSEDGSNTEVYNVNIQRKNYEEGPSTLLKSLAVNPGNIDFISENLTYKIKVAKNVSQVTVSEILPVDPNADVSAAYAIENNTLVADITHDRYVKITVMNEGNVSVYTLEFIQTESETSIKDVNGNDGDKIFKGELNEETGNIEIEVDYDTEIDENFELDINLDFPGGKVDIDGPNINGDGDYEYTVTVEDENGNQEDHTIVIKKDKNSNAYLKELALFGENLVGFNKHTENYEYTIEAGQDVILTDVTYKTEDEDASAEASMDGDIITIVVTAQNKTTKTYTVTIIEKVDNQALLYGLGLLEAGISPSFNRNESRYFASVPNEFEAVTVVIGAADGVETKITSDRTVNDRKVSDLEVGSNRIDIEVSLDEIVYTYTIFVERQQASNSNYLDSLQVFDLIDEGKEYTLSPSFSKDTQFYTVEVPYDASSFEIKGSFDESLTVSGLDTLVIQDFLYIHKVRVADENGVVREYALQIVKAESNNTYLDDLAVSEGIMSPVFEKDVTHYNVDVGSDIDSIEITYTKGSEDQIVTGDGKKDLVFGRNTFTVKVESGSKVQEYTIYVYRDNVPPKLTSLSISEGELTPEFDPDKYVYRAFVGSEIDSVDITAESNHEVSGDIGTQTLKKGDNIFEIKVTDGAKESSYYIIVYRESDNSDSDDSFFQGNVDLAYLNIPNEEMNETFSSDLLEYTATLKDPYYGELNIIAVPRNPEANVAISGHTDLGNGVHDILITVSLENGKSQTTTITVTIDDYYLQSDIHDIGETYILTIREKQTVLDVKNQMLNENEYLIISQNGEHLNDDDIVGTGAIIRLVVEDKEHDSKVLIVKGDVNGDGEVGVPDRMQAQSKVLGNDLTEVQMLAADVTNDDEIAINDVMLIQAHVLEIENLYEMEEE